MRRTTRFPSLAFLIGALGVVAACADSARTSGTAQSAPPHHVAPTSCDASHVAWTTGERIGDALTDKAQRDSGAQLVRVIRPGQAVTKDFSPDRLNLDLDADDKVVRAHCG